MKTIKYLILTVLILGNAYVWAGNIGPSYITTSTTLERPGAGKQNCLTDISASGSNFPAAGYTVMVLDGSLTQNTTIYSVTVTTGPLIEVFNSDYPLCTTHNSSMTFVGSYGGSTVKINYQGFIKGQ